MTMSSRIEVLPTPEALIQSALARVVEQIHQAIRDRGRCSLALSGGSTPKPLYAALAQQDLPLGQLHLFWGDERFVPADHADSNYAMVKQVWLDPVGFPAENVYAVPTHGMKPETAAAQYEQTLRDFFETEPERVPAFDLILLGLGDDGHTASLFPQTAALEVRDRLVTVGEKSGQPRITFTVPLINQAREVLFVVAGANKQTALAQIFAAQADARQYPARLVQSEQVTWLLDSAAGAELGQ